MRESNESIFGCQGLIPVRIAQLIRTIRGLVRFRARRAPTNCPGVSEGLIVADRGVESAAGSAQTAADPAKILVHLLATTSSILEVCK